MGRLGDYVDDDPGDVLGLNGQIELYIFSTPSLLAGLVMWSVSSVATAPSSTRDTRTPRAVTSWRSDSLKALTAHLLAL